MLNCFPMKNINPLLLVDCYKTTHHLMFAEGTTLCYSNFTPRSQKFAPKGADKVVSFGQQMTLTKIHEWFKNDFFAKPKEEVCGEVKRELSLFLNTDYNVSHFEKLHDLGYLPIEVKSITEGTLVPYKVPVLTIVNTHPEFYWLTNYLETIISNQLWKPMTSATIAHTFKNIFLKWQNKTDQHNKEWINFAGCDFSLRGLDSVESGVSSGLGHATSFLGSDNIPTVYGARNYYGESGFICGSVVASEHSVTCSHGDTCEYEFFDKMLNKFPAGILSLVSDTWDLFNVCTDILPKLKNKIESRDGCLVIRPDSGNPVDITCGTKSNNAVTPQEKGVIECLWDVFGGTINDQGFKVLNPCIRMIYGDSMTIERVESICERLSEKGFACTNTVFGLGSYLYNTNSRDTLGLACKATYVEINGEGRNIFKDPITDDGMKKSAKGLLKVIKNSEGVYELIDQVSWDEEKTGELRTIYKDGEFFNKTTLTEIRERLK